ncbi:MAG: SH3 domain-containing protein [Flavobacteriales bacterium]|nr:SH3 domain-containing protein [Flavobacteriales bacterium]
MKQLLPFLFVLTTMSASAVTKLEADSMAARAQRAYAMGDARTALAAYDSIAVASQLSGLAIEHRQLLVQTGDVAHAILHYERGLRLAPGDEDLQANLDLANEQVKDRIAEKPSFALGTTWARIRGGHDPDQWARRSLWVCALFFALLTAAILLRGKGPRRIAFTSSGLALIFLALCIAFAVARHNEVVDDGQAIIMEPKVDVLGEPRTGSKVLFVLHKGTKLTVLQEANGWYEVQLPNGNVGWMPPAALERI